MTQNLEITEQPQIAEKTKLAVIDTDIHNFDVYDDPVFNQIISDYLAPEWRDYHEMIGMRGHYGVGYPRHQPNAARTDAWPPSGRPPGTDLDFMREQLLDAFDMDYGVLNPLVGAGGQGNLILVRSMAKAYGLAGVRFGYGIMAADTAALLHRVRPPFDTSVLAQAAALAALQDEQFLHRTLDLNRSGKRQLYAAFAQLGLDAVPSHANFILVHVGRPAAAVARRLLEQGVIVRAPRHPALARHLRVSIGTRQELERFIAALRRTLAEPACGTEAPGPGAGR